MKDFSTYRPDEKTHHTFQYGKCKRAPFIQNDLWFVYVPSNREPRVYYVPKKFANHKTIDEFWIEKEKWENVAIVWMPLHESKWNSENECTWKDMPYQTYVNSDGVSFRIGHPCQQSKKFPNIEFRYIILNAEEEEYLDQETGKDIFVVAKAFTTPQVIEKMGTNIKNWMMVCKSHPTGLAPWDTYVEDEDMGYHRPQKFFESQIYRDPKLDGEKKNIFQHLFGK